LRAAYNEYEGVVRIQLDREDVDPDKADTFGRTQLSQATVNGNEGVVMLLLDRDDVNSNSAVNRGRTLLLWAADNRHEGAVRILLKQDGSVLAQLMYCTWPNAPLVGCAEWA